MNTETAPGTAPQVMDMLESTQADIEQFRKEIGQEQVSVQCRYEQLKQELQAAIGQMKELISENKDLARDIKDALRTRLATLEEQARVRAVLLTEVQFEEQLARIRKGVDDLVNYLGTLSFHDFSLASILDKAYRFRIKLAILRLRFQLGALEMKGAVLDARHDVKQRIRTLREKAERTEAQTEKRWNVFRQEMAEAYEHLQKAFTSK
jgi:hypothetical protein